MNRGRRRIGLLFAAVGALLAASPPRAAAAPPAHPLSVHDIQREREAFRKLFVIDVYQKHGDHNPKWDADALALLAAQIHADANEWDGTCYQLDDCMPARERAALADRVLAAGCKDAAVMVEAAAAYYAANLPAKGLDVVHRVAERIETSPYAPVVRLQMLMRVDSTMRSAEHTAINGIDARKAELFKQVLTDATTLPKYREMVWVIADGITQYAEQGEDDLFAKSVEGLAGADPWMLETYLGHAETSRAWLARSDQTGDKLTPANVDGFQDHMAKARKHLLAAIAADDSLAMPYAMMIQVALGDDKDAPRDWFDRTMLRQVDLPLAFDSYINTLLPRWGGSHEAMLAFGDEMVRTGRFDTFTPARITQVVQALEVDQPRMTRDDLIAAYPIVIRAADGYVLNNGQESIRNWASSLRVFWACRAARWDDAATFLSEMAGAQWSRPSLAIPSRDDLIRLLMAHPDLREGRDVGEWVAAHRSAAWRDIDATLQSPATTRRADRLGQIAAGMDANDPGRAWVERRAAIAAMPERMAKGPIPVDIPDDLHDWRILGAGRWAVQSEAGRNILVATAAEDGLEHIFSPIYLPPRYELSLTIRGNRKEHSAHRIVTIAFHSAPQLTSLRVDLSTGAIAFYRDEERANQESGVNVDPTGIRLVIRNDHGHVTATAPQMNGTCESAVGGPDGSWLSFAFGATDPGCTATFSDIVLRPLPDDAK